MIQIANKSNVNKNSHISVVEQELMVQKVLTKEILVMLILGHSGKMSSFKQITIPMMLQNSKPSNKILLVLEY